MYMDIYVSGTDKNLIGFPKNNAKNCSVLKYGIRS